MECEWMRLCDRSQVGKGPSSRGAITADAVILAAGTGIGTLAAVPMLHSPGLLAHTSTATAATARMKALFVDTIGGLHVLSGPMGGTLLAAS